MKMYKGQTNYLNDWQQKDTMLSVTETTNLMPKL